MTKNSSVLFVCLGNICRSPMAEAIFANIIRKNNLTEQFKVDSAGTSSYHIGSAPDSRSVATCKKHGIPVNHRARQVTKQDFYNFDYILGMDDDNLSNLLRLKPSDSKAVVKLFGDFDPRGEREIEDPYYGGNEGFEHNYQQCTRSAQALLDHIQT